MGCGIWRGCRECQRLWGFTMRRGHWPCPVEVIDEAFASTAERGAGLPCVPEPATLKRRGADGCVVETVDRRGLFQAQTPQCFRLLELLKGYEMLVKEGMAHEDLTDDAQDCMSGWGWGCR